MGLLWVPLFSGAIPSHPVWKPSQGVGRPAEALGLHAPPSSSISTKRGPTSSLHTPQDEGLTTT